MTREEAKQILEINKPVIKRTSISARRYVEAFDMAISALSVPEKIRAEIEALNPVDFGSMFSYESHNGARDMKDDCLDIIDKYL